MAHVTSATHPKDFHCTALSISLVHRRFMLPAFALGRYLSLHIYTHVMHPVPPPFNAPYLIWFFLQVTAVICYSPLQ